VELKSLSYGVTLNIRDTAYHYVVVVIVADIDQEPTAKEPEKCAEWIWAPWRQLPQPLFSSLEECLRVKFDPLDIV